MRTFIPTLAPYTGLGKGSFRVLSAHVHRAARGVEYWQRFHLIAGEELERRRGRCRRAPESPTRRPMSVVHEFAESDHPRSGPVGDASEHHHRAATRRIVRGASERGSLPVAFARELEHPADRLHRGGCPATTRRVEPIIVSPARHEESIVLMTPTTSIALVEITQREATSLSRRLCGSYSGPENGSNGFPSGLYARTSGADLMPLHHHPFICPLSPLGSGFESP
jgi:hypothetical protein